MVLASLSDTTTGAVLGAGFTSFAIQRNDKLKDPVGTVVSGTVYGAIAPSAIQVIHQIANRVATLALSYLNLALSYASCLQSKLVTAAQANPAIAAVALIGGALLFGAVCLSGRSS